MVRFTAGPQVRLKWWPVERQRAPTKKRKIAAFVQVAKGLLSLKVTTSIFFSVRRLLGSRQVVTQCLCQLNELCSILHRSLFGVSKESMDLYAVQLVHVRWRPPENKEQKSDNFCSPIYWRGPFLRVCFFSLGRPVFASLIFLVLRSKKQTHERWPPMPVPPRLCQLRALDIARCCSESKKKHQQMWETLPSTLPNFESCKHLRLQTEHSHMFASWTVHHHMFAERVLFRRPAVFEAKTALQANIRDSTFPDRRLRQRAPPAALAAHQAALTALHQHAVNHQQAHPVNFELPNEWIATITSDKQHYREHFMKGLTGSNA